MLYRLFLSFEYSNSLLYIKIMKRLAIELNVKYLVSSLFEIKRNVKMSFKKSFTHYGIIYNE